MKLNAGKSKTARLKPENADWEKAIDTLARNICPVEEWQEYEKRRHQLSWQSSQKDLGQSAARVHVFPVWRRYRHKALQVATLHRALPLLKRLPLKVSCVLGDILFK